MTIKQREGLERYWADVRAGRREKPMRKSDGTVRRTLSVALDGQFGPDRGKRLVVTLKADGLLEIRPERTQRTETVHILDVYRFAIRCRVNLSVLERARQRKAKKAERLARQRQERAEKRLFAGN